MSDDALEIAHDCTYNELTWRYVSHNMRIARTVPTH